jgi:hypothetical protein
MQIIAEPTAGISVAPVVGNPLQASAAAQSNAAGRCALSDPPPSSGAAASTAPKEPLIMGAPFSTSSHFRPTTPFIALQVRLLLHMACFTRRDNRLCS